tara:strand:+ start:623 stop:991 length:369 start_codon:yes stop_codon:yes gene_type:complete
MKRKITILEAITSLKPEYSSSPIITSSPDENVDTAETVITWGGVAPISNSDIKAEQTRLQNLEDNCYYPRRVGTATTSGYLQISEQLDQLYRDVNAGKFGADAKTGEWFVGITTVKTKFPKS